MNKHIEQHALPACGGSKKLQPHWSYEKRLICMKWNILGINRKVTIGKKILNNLQRENFNLNYKWSTRGVRRKCIIQMQHWK